MRLYDGGEFTIAEATTAISEAGMTDYIDRLQLELFDQTLEILAKFEQDVIPKIRKGWQGISEQQLELDYRTMRNIMEMEFKEEKEDLRVKLEAIKNAYYAVDKDIYGQR